jgi:hypothetical protein
MIFSGSVINIPGNSYKTHKILFFLSIQSFVIKNSFSIVGYLAKEGDGQISHGIENERNS